MKRGKCGVFPRRPRRPPISSANAAEPPGSQGAWRRRPEILRTSHDLHRTELRQMSSYLRSILRSTSAEGVEFLLFFQTRLFMKRKMTVCQQHLYGFWEKPLHPPIMSPRK